MHFPPVASRCVHRYNTLCKNHVAFAKKNIHFSVFCGLIARAYRKPDLFRGVAVQWLTLQTWWMSFFYIIRPVSTLCTHVFASLFWPWHHVKLAAEVATGLQDGVAWWVHSGKHILGTVTLTAGHSCMGQTIRRPLLREMQTSVFCSASARDAISHWRRR